MSVKGSPGWLVHGRFTALLEGAAGVRPPCALPTCPAFPHMPPPQSLPGRDAGAPRHEVSGGPPS